MNETLLTIQEAATFLGVSPTTLRRWEEKKMLLPYRTAGNQRRYGKEQLQHFKINGFTSSQPVTPAVAVAPAIASASRAASSSSQMQTELGNAKAKEVSPLLIPGSEDQLQTSKEIKNNITASDSHSSEGKNEPNVQVSHPKLTPFTTAFGYPMPSQPNQTKQLTPMAFVIAGLVLTIGFMVAAAFSPLWGASLDKFAKGLPSDPSINSGSTTQVLAANDKQPAFMLKINVPSIFGKQASFLDSVAVKKGLTVNGEAVLTGGIKTENAAIDAGTGKITASNVVYSIVSGSNISISGDPQNPVITANIGDGFVTSFQGQNGAVALAEGSGIGLDGLTITNTGVLSLQGQSGALAFTQGTGITLSGLTITNSDPGSAQKIFGTFRAGGTDINAGSSTDTFTFAAGSGVTLTPDTTGKSLTISASGIGASQWTTTGSDIYYALGNVGIGTTTPGAALDVVGTGRISGAVTLSNLGTGIIKSNGSGLLSSSALDLATEISGVLSVANGGSGLSAIPTNGQLLIGNGSGFDLGNLAGTANQVIINNSAGSITFSTPQDINIAAAPTFASLNLTNNTNQITLGSGLTGTLNLEALTANRTYTLPDAGGVFCLSSGNCGSGGGGTIAGSGITNYIAKFTSSTGISESSIYDNGKVGIGTISPEGLLSVSGAPAGKALAVFNYTGSDQNILTASASGITRLTLSNSGNLNIIGGAYQIGGSTVIDNDSLGAGILDSSLTGVGALTSGSITTNFGNIDVGNDGISGGDITATGTTGFIASGTGAGLTFSGLGNHDIMATSGILRLGAVTLNGTVSGNGQNITGLNNVAAGGTVTFSALSTGVVQSDGSGILSSSALNLAGGSSFVTGILPVVNGGTGLGSFNAGDLIYASAGNTLAALPIGDNAQVLTVSGGSLTWQSTSSLGFFQRNSGVISSLNTTDDLAIGGTSTASAKFQIVGTTGNATSSGTLTFNTAGSIQTTNNQSLSLGGNTTGDITFSPRNGNGTVNSTGDLNLVSGKNYQINGANVLSAASLGSGVTGSSLTSVGAINSGTIATGFGTITTANTITGTTINGTAGINTGSGAGTSRISSGGNLTNIGTTQLNGVTYTWPGGDGSSDYILTTDGNGGLVWRDITGVGGAGDLTAIGDVTTGAAFTASGTQGTSLYFYDVDGRGQLTTDNLTAARTFTFPDASGTVCLTSGNCAGSGGGLTGAGTAGQIAFFNGTGSITSETNGFTWDTTNNKFGIGTDTPIAKFDVNGNVTGKALAIFNETGNQDILTASASGTTVVRITNSGDLMIEGQLADLTQNAITVNDSLDLISGNAFRINGTSVLSGTTLGVGIVNSSLTQVGSLVSGSIANGFGSIVTGNAIQGSDITAVGTTGFTASGNGAGLLFTGTGNHLISASSGTLQVGAATLTGAISGNNQNVTGLSNLSASGNVTFSGLSTGIVQSDTNGLLSSAALNLAGGSSYVTGTLPVGNGGTGATAVGAAGGVAYSNGSTYAFTAAGSSGQVLVSNGAGTPTWTDAAGVGTNYWQRNFGALAPIAITDDLLVGGASTASAKFQIFGNTGNASTSGDLTFNSAATIQSTRNQALTFGGNTTGNIVFSPLNGAGSVLVNGNVSLATGNIYRINGSDVLSATTLGTGVTGSSLTQVGVLTNGSIASGFGSILTANTIQGSNITASGTTGFTASGNGAGLLFTGTGNHLIRASAGNLQVAALELTGELNANTQNIVGINNLSADATITFGGFSSNGGILYTNASGVVSQVAAGTATQVLKGGTSPSFSAVALGTDVSGTLPVANGGTGVATLASNGVLYGNGTGTVQVTTAPTGGQILLGNVSGVPTFTAISGGVTLSNAGVASIALSTTGETATTSSNSGLEFSTANGLSLIRGCTTNQILKWNDTTDLWECANDAGGSGGSAAVINVKNNEVAVGSSVDTLDFSTDFSLTASPSNEANISLADDGINFSELADAMTLDAATSIALSNFDFTIGTNAGNGRVIISPNAGGAAALTINKQGDGDIFTASASGATRLTLGSSGNLNLAGGDYQISGNSVLSSTTLGTNVVSSSLTQVGPLASGSIATGFGAIQTSNAIEGSSFVANGAGAGLTFSGSGNHDITASVGVLRLGAVTLNGAVTGNGQSITGLAQLTTDNLRLDGNTIDTTSGDLTIDANGGNILFADGDVLNVGGAAATGYNFFAGSTAGNNTADGDDDLFIADELEVDGAIRFDNSSITLGNGAFANCTALETLSGILTCGSDEAGAGGTNYWQLNNGTVSPFSDTLDLLVGGTASNSAKFAVLNVNNGTPTASVSAGLSGAAYLTASGTLQSTANQTLTLGGDTTGNIVLNPLNGTGKVRVNGLASCDTIDTDAAGNLICGTDAGGSGSAGVVNVQSNGTPVGSSVDTLNFTTDFSVSASPATRANISIADDILDFSEIADTLTLDASTNIAVSNFDLILGTNAGNGGIVVSPNAGGKAALIVNKQGNNDIFTASSSGTTRFTVLNNGDVRINNLNTASCDVKADTSGILSCGTDNGGINYWQLNNGAIAPFSNTLDVLVGGTSSSSAKFAVLNVNNGTPTASVSAGVAGGVYISATGNLATTANQSLTLGGSTTGSITLDSGNGSINVLDALALTGNFTQSGATTFATGTGIVSLNGNVDAVNGLDVTGANFTVGGANATITTAGVITGTQVNADNLRLDGNTLEATTGDLTIDAAGGNVIIANGDTLNVGGAAAAAYNFFAGSTAGNNTADGDDDLYIADELEVDGAVRFDNSSITLGNGAFTTCGVLETVAGVVTCGSDDGGTNYWQLNNGAIAPFSNTLDVLVGGTSSSSAKFAVLNVNNGTPTASVSAGTNGAAYLTAAGNLQTTANQSLTIGGSTTGSINLDSGNGAINILDAATLAGNFTQSGATTFTTGTGVVSLNGNVDAANGLDVTGADLTVGGTNTTITTAGIFTTAQANVDSLRLDGNTLATTANDLTIDANGGNILFANGDTLNVGGATAQAYNFFAGSTAGNNTADGDDDLYIADELEVDGAVRFDNSSITLGNAGFANCSSIETSSGALICGTDDGGTNYWQLNSGTVSPFSNTLDVLVGGTSSSSAKFAVLNVNNGTPTASVSAGTDGAAYLTATGSLGTTANQTLTLGGSTTGTITLDSGNGSINVVDAVTLAGNFTQSGVTTFSTGTGALSLNGNTTFATGTTITQNGTGQVSLGGNVNATAGVDVTGADLTVGGTNATITTAGVITGTQVNGDNLRLDGNTLAATSGDLTIDATDGNILFANGDTLNAGGAAAAAFNFFAGSTAGNNTADGDDDLFIADELEVDGAVRFDNGSITLGSGTFANCTSIETSGGALTCGTDDGGTNFWQVNNGAIAPFNNTLDLLVGSTSSSSAKFAVLNVNSGTPTASVSAGGAGAASLTATGVLGTTARQSLTLGNATTGNIVLNGFTAGVVKTNASGVLSAGTINLNAGSSDLSGTLAVANGGTGATAFNPGGILYGNSASAIASSLQGSTGQAIISGGAGAPTFTTGTLALAGNFATSGAFAVTLTATANTNVTLPTTGTLATLAGSETFSNKVLTAPRFADGGFIADANGNELLVLDTVASAVNQVQLSNGAAGTGPAIAATGDDAAVALSIDAKGSGALNLNNTGTGNILLGGGSGSTGCTVTNSTGAFACSGAIAATGTISGSNFSGTTSGTNTGDQTITLTGDVTGSGTGSFATTIADNSIDGTDIALGSDAAGDLMYYDGTNWVRLAAGSATQVLHSGATPSWSAVSLTADVSGTLPIARGGTNGTATPTAGAVAFGTGTAYSFTLAGTGGQCLLSAGAGTPTWGACGGTNYWQLNNGAVSPFSDTADLLVGGTATASAKFAVINVNGSASPVASLSATTSSGGNGNGIVIGGNGSIQSLRNNTLTIGGNTTGNIQLTPANGAATGVVNATGNINLASGLSYQIAGTNVLSGSTLGTGVTGSSLTSVGVLNGGSIDTNFGAIDVGNDNISGDNLLARGTTGVTLSGVGSDLIFNAASGTNIIGQTGGGTLQINAFTLGGAIVGGGFNITGLGQLAVDTLTLDGSTFSATGDIIIDPTGGDIIFADNDTLNIGGNPSDVAYNVIGDTTAGASASVGSDDDLYIEGNLEVDGTIIGSFTTGLTQGSVAFIGAGGALTQDNANFFWDDASNELGIGTNAPANTLHVNGIAQSNGFLSAAGAAPGNYAFRGNLPNNGFNLIGGYIGSETEPFFRVLGFGRIEWGAGGSTAVDTNLYRSAADLLRTDDSFFVDGDPTAASSRALEIANSGAVTGTGYGAFITKSGASTTNVGLYATATGATNNYAAIFDAGNVGIGIAAPSDRLHIGGAGNILLTGGVLQDIGDLRFKIDADNDGTNELSVLNGGGTEVFSLQESGTVVIGTASNGLTFNPASGPAYAGTARPTKTISLQPEYAGATLTAFYGAATDTSVTGLMTSDIETTAAKNLRTYYEWESSLGALNYYTVAVRVKLPKDFSGWPATNAIQIDHVTESIAAASNVLDIRVYLESDLTTVIAADTGNVSAVAATWRTESIAGTTLNDGSAPVLDGADDTAVIFLRMGSTGNNYSRIGEIRLNYLSSF